MGLGSLTRSLRWKVLLSALVPSGLVLVVVAVLALYAYEKVAEDVVKQRDTELARVTAARLAEGMERYSFSVESITSSVDFSDVELSEFGPMVEGHRNLLVVFDAGVMVYDPQGGAVWSQPSLSRSNLDQYPIHEELDQALQTRRPSFSGVFIDPISGEDVVAILVPLKGLDNEMIGVLAGMSNIRTSLLGATFAEVLELQAGESGLAYLVDGKGRLIYHRDVSRIGANLSGSQPVSFANRGETGAVITEGPGGERVISGYSPVPGTDWGVVTQERWDNIAGPIRNFSALLVALLILGGVLALGLMFLAIGKILQPIRELTLGAQRIAGGDFGHTITAQTGDEIQALAEQFNYMAGALQRSYSELEAKVDERTRELRQREERLATFNRMIRAITATLDLEGIFHLLSSEVQRLIPHDRASLALLGPDDRSVTVYATAGPGSALGTGQVVPMDGSNLSEVIMTGKGKVTPNLDDQPTSPARDGLHELGIHSTLNVPLREGDFCFGTLNLGSFQKEKYGTEELELAQEIADQVAVAIINARHHKEAEESNERLSRIYEHSNDAIFVIDPAQDEIIDVNKAGCEMLGYSREELLTTPVSEIHRLDMPILVAFTTSVLDRGQGWTDELTCITSSGDVVPAEISASVVTIDDRQCIIAIIRDITERKRAEEIQHQQTQELAISGERNRLAREIHDTLAQGLTGMIWQINAAERAVEKGGEPALQHLQRIRDLARDNLQEARRSVWDLRAGPLEGRTLAEALREETEKAAEEGSFQASFQVTGDEKVLLSGVESSILRICQESLANVLKYAQAKNVQVTLDFDGPRVSLKVTDDGVGFDPDGLTRQNRNGGGFGLINMRERARLLGGEFSVASEPGRGTIVQATIGVE